MRQSYFCIAILSFILFSGFVIPEKDKVLVYIFLGEQCVISQNYSLQLKELHQQFASENIEFSGYFPNPNTTAAKVSAFQEKYQIPFTLHIDHGQLKMNEFGVTVTPEVVVYQPLTRKIFYQGRIDNTYFEVGKRRRVTTNFELKEVLESIQNDRPVLTKRTEAVGCFITPIDPNFQGIPMCQPNIQVEKQ